MLHQKMEENHTRLNFTATDGNEMWKSDATWYGTYAANYAGAINNPSSPLFGNVAGSNAFARSQADVGRSDSGTAAFQSAFNTVIADPSSLTGSKLVDNSKIYHSDANYNFKDLVKFGEIQVGGSYRNYQLDSHGRIYTDATSLINYDEYGAYAQLQKKFMEDRFKFTDPFVMTKPKILMAIILQDCPWCILEAKKSNIISGHPIKPVLETQPLKINI